MVSILNTYESLNEHLPGDLEPELFEDLMQHISPAKSHLEDLLDAAEEPRPLGGSNVSRPGRPGLY